MLPIPMVFVPATDSDAVRKLQEHLGTDEPAMRVTVQAEKSRPRDCFVNVRNRIECDGKGEMKLGWAIWQHSHLFIEAEEHAIFDPGDGNPPIDCTPHTLPDGAQVTEILFVPNADATYDFETTDTPDNIRVPLVDDPRVSRALSLMTKKTALMNSVPGIDVVLPPHIAKQVASLEFESGMLLMEAMQPTVQRPAPSRKIGRNDPCPCESGKKYKKCCGK